MRFLQEYAAEIKLPMDQIGRKESTIKELQVCNTACREFGSGIPVMDG
jgi:hypothetical protein